MAIPQKKLRTILKILTLVNSNMTVEKNWYTIKELSDEIDRSNKSVWRWCNTGKLKSERVGAQYRILKEDWLEAKANFNRRSSKVAA